MRIMEVNSVFCVDQCPQLIARIKSRALRFLLWKSTLISPKTHEARTLCGPRLSSDSYPESESRSADATLVVWRDSKLHLRSVRID
jgi:hypothetical protein